MSRFNYEPKTFLLRFEDMPGLEIVMRPVSVGQLLEMAGLADQLKGGEDAGKLFGMFAGRLQSWNLDVGGQPVPATAEGVASLDVTLFLQLFEGWFEGMTRAPKASTKPAEPTGGPGLQDLPMAPLRAV